MSAEKLSEKFKEPMPLPRGWDVKGVFDQIFGVQPVPLKPYVKEVIRAAVKKEDPRPRTEFEGE